MKIDLRVSVTKHSSGALKLCIYAHDNALIAQFPNGLEVLGELTVGTLTLFPGDDYRVSSASDGPKSTANRVYDYLELPIERLGFDTYDPLLPASTIGTCHEDGTLEIAAAPRTAFRPRPARIKRGSPSPRHRDPRNEIPPEDLTARFNSLDRDDKKCVLRCRAGLEPCYTFPPDLRRLAKLPGILGGIRV